MERENLWQVTSVTAEPCYVFDFYPSKFMSFGNSSCNSVWLSHSPLVTVIPLAVRMVHMQWEEEKWTYVVYFLQDVCPSARGFPGFSWSSLDLLGLLPKYIPFPLKSLKQL